MLQACLNGNATGAAVPVTPEALARDVTAAHRLGLRHIHLHPRDAHGAESLQAGVVDAAVSAARAVAPDMAIGIGTGAWIAPGPQGRLGDMADWSVLPDYVSINLREKDAPEVMQLMRQRGVGIEAGIWALDDAERFCALDPAPVTRILIELPDDPDVSAEGDAIRACLADAGRTEPALLHGEGASAWPCLRRAAELGLSARMGFEDCRHLPDGTAAADNESLLLAAAKIFLDHARTLS